MGSSRTPALYSRHGDTRSSPVVTPGGSLLNPKFFRNGIVMLFLVVGTAALLFTWINTTNEPQHGRLLGSS